MDRESRRSGVCVGRILAAGRARSPAAVERPVFFDFRNLSLFVPRRAPVVLSGSVFTIGGPDGSYLATDDGAHHLRGVSAISLAMDGEQAGCLRFDLNLDAGPAVKVAEVSFLDASFRIFHRDSEFSANDSGFFVKSRRYPFLSEDVPLPLTLYVQLDPLNVLDASRTYFSFVHPTTGDRNKKLPSGFRTTLGRTIRLTPVDHDSRLVFDVMPRSGKPNPADPLYLTPSGNFEIGVEGAGDDNLLCGLSGAEFLKLPPRKTSRFLFEPGRPAFAPDFASVEALTRTMVELLAVETGRTLDRAALESTLQGDHGQALASRPELLAHFPTAFQFDRRSLEELAAQETLADMIAWFQSALQAQNPNHELLTDFATTSWTYVAQDTGSSPVYYAQPDRAVFYQAAVATDATPDVSGDEFLPYLEVPATPLPAPAASAPNGDTGAFPMLPYGGVQGSLSDLRLLELQVVSLLRRSRIHEGYERFVAAQVQAGVAAGERGLPLLPAATTQPPAVTGWTEQGFLADFSSGFETWASLLLARDSTGHSLSLSNLDRDAPIRAALQSGNLFLVISNPDELKPYFLEHSVVIAGWTFDLDPAKWAAAGTVLIFKFYDKPLRDLVAQSSAWTLSSVFNNDAEATAAAIGAMLDKALLSDVEGATEKEREKWGALARAASNPQWSGILALHVEVPPSGFPPELKALAAGIQGGQLVAPYFGVETTPVVTQSGAVHAGPSSLFALIDYADDTAPLPSPSGYNFVVTLLSAVFQNSALKAFAAEIAVTLDRLFDERAVLIDSATGRNIVVLKGTAETHGDKTKYVFSFSGDNRFDLPASCAIEETGIVKAAFGTDPPASAPSAATGWKVNQANHAAKAETVTVGSGTNAPAPGDLFAIGTDTQAYTVVSFANQVITYTPPARSPFTDGAALEFGAVVTGRFSFWGNLSFRAWTAGAGAEFAVDQPDHQKGARAVTIFHGSSVPNPGDFLAVGGDGQPYRVVAFERGASLDGGVITYSPPALTAFPDGSPIRRVDPGRAFDILSFGQPADTTTGTARGLRFANLVVTMAFVESRPRALSFTFDSRQISFDPTQSGVRPGSLYARFPLKLTGLLYSGGDKKVDDYGFMPVSTPLGGSAPAGAWYGLTFDLDLGSVGALAGKAGLVVSVLAAWQPGKPGQAVYAGLRLPGSSGGKKEISIQGVIKIVFNSIQFAVSTGESDTGSSYSYVLKLKKIMLKFLILSLPPKGQTELIIFGDPQGSLEDRTIGWYAAYAKQK